MLAYARNIDNLGALAPAVERIAQKHVGGKADYFLCGPKPFLRTFVSGMALAGVPSGKIHYEFFGPADDLVAA